RLRRISFPLNFSSPKRLRFSAIFKAGCELVCLLSGCLAASNVGVGSP
uniref:Uncharacterized protein n=1 Tax=Anopheles atroparvus TaxID=41427 RepID=A0AAG5CRM6_ANOAO